MRVIVAGGREVSDASLVAEAIEASGFEITELVSGGQGVHRFPFRGVDVLGEQWAIARGIPVHRIEADWDEWERRGNRNAAGPVRNGQLADYARAGNSPGALVAIPTGGPGTRNMIKQARAKGLLVYEHNAAARARWLARDANGAGGEPMGPAAPLTQGRLF